MDPSERWAVGLFAVAILVNALFSAAETALVSIRRSRLQSLADEGRPAALLAQRVLDHPERYFASIQTIITSLTAIGTLAAASALYVSSVANGKLDLSHLLLIGIPALLLFLLFGEILPKTFARRYADTATLVLVRPVVWMSRLVFPLVQVLVGISNGLVRLVPGQRPLARNPYITEEEIKVLVEKGEEMGTLEEDEREMVTAIFDLDRRVVREVMVPRVDVVAADIVEPLDAVIDLCIASGHTRIPVYEGSLDNVIGVLHAKDLLRYLRHGRQDYSLRAVMRQGYFVPENKNAKVLLEEMRSKRIPFAVVVDEYGGTAGIITIEDLIEEIVGEIRDEYDIEEEDIVRLGDDVALVNGRTPIEEINDEMDVEIENVEYDSVGGFVVGLFGHPPNAGDEVTWENIRFVVERVSGNRVQQVRVLIDRSKQPSGNAG